MCNLHKSDRQAGDGQRSDGDATFEEIGLPSPAMISDWGSFNSGKRAQVERCEVSSGRWEEGTSSSRSEIKNKQ